MTTTASMTKQQMSQMVDSCMKMHQMCEEAMMHALNQGGDMAGGMMMRALMDCADMSRTCADMCMRGSSMAPRMSGLCAEACQATAEACSRFPQDEMMTRCADMAMKTAAMCRQMAGMPAK